VKAGQEVTEIPAPIAETRRAMIDAATEMEPARRVEAAMIARPVRAAAETTGTAVETVVAAPVIATVEVGPAIVVAVVTATPVVAATVEVGPAVAAALLGELAPLRLLALHRLTPGFGTVAGRRLGRGCGMGCCRGRPAAAFATAAAAMVATLRHGRTRQDRHQGSGKKQ